MIPSNFQGQLIAEYDMKPLIKVHCLLDVIKMHQESGALVCTVGVREIADTKLPVGFKVLIRRNLDPNGGVINQVAVVKEVKKPQGKAIHVLDILNEPLPDYERTMPRASIKLPCRRGKKVFFETSNISLTGAQFLYQSVLTSAVLGKTLNINIEIDGVETLFACRVCYILYNWWDQRHKVGVKFLDVAPDVEERLEAIILPALTEGEKRQLEAYKDGPSLSNEPNPLLEVAEPSQSETGNDDKEVKTLIDPESGRIRFDN